MICRLRCLVLPCNKGYIQTPSALQVSVRVIDRLLLPSVLRIYIKAYIPPARMIQYYHFPTINKREKISNVTQGKKTRDCHRVSTGNSSTDRDLGSPCTAPVTQYCRYYLARIPPKSNKSHNYSPVGPSDWLMAVILFISSKVIRTPSTQFSWFNRKKRCTLHTRNTRCVP